MNVEVFEGEVGELEEVLRLWRDEIPEDKFIIKPDIWSVSFRLKFLMDSSGCDVLVLKSGKGRILGFMGLVAMPSPLDGLPQAVEHFFYVLREHRGIGAVKMIHAAESWAKQNGCRHFQLTASRLANAKHQRVEKLYSKLGYVPFESTYIKEFG